MKSTVLSVGFSAIIITMLLLVGGCSLNVSRIRSKEPHVKEQLKNLNYGLKSESWEMMEHFFSEDYEGGYQNLRPRMEKFWRHEDLVEIHFNVLRVFESDDLINARVRWHKSYIDQAGILKSMSGTSEIIFKQTNKQLRILAIHGKSFF